MIESSLENEVHQKIHVRSWSPPCAACGIVVIVPGFNSHGGYYEWVADQLLEMGLSVAAVDLRGRGRSEGERFYVQSFADYISDVALVVDHMAAGKPDLSMFLLGHSAGGVVSCLYALEYPHRLSGMICESFAYQLPAPDLALSALKGLSHLAPHAHVLKLHNADFSRDPAVVEAMDSDVLIFNEIQPAQTVAELVRADERLKNGFPTFRLPVLILHGTGDRAAKASGSQFFLDTVGSQDKTLKLYEGHFHDLLNDYGRELVMEDVKDWLAARLGVGTTRRGVASAYRHG